MARVTRSSAYAVPITTPIRILDKNPNRVMYSIQNLDGTNYVAVATHPQVTAGTFGASEGQHITAGQSVSDTDDKGEVWIVANTAAVNVAVLEVIEPKEGERRSIRTPVLRAARTQLRRGTRQGP